MAEREHILAEIRRTAKHNGGLPLGSKRFADETGIRETDWAGRFWARWGDALTEAGFAPNQMQAAYPEDFLLERLASLALELGHFPVAREIAMKGHTDPGFPSKNVFHRLGSKSQIAGKLLQFCKERPAFEVVAAYCVPLTTSSEKASPAPKERIRVTGDVYLFKVGRFYKIGRSNATGRREYELSIQLPEKPTLVHVIKTDDPAGIESYWHRRFESRRKNGEWFELSAEDVAAFKWRKYM